MSEYNLVVIHWAKSS